MECSAACLLGGAVAHEQLLALACAATSHWLCLLSQGVHCSSPGGRRRSAAPAASLPPMTALEEPMAALPPAAPALDASPASPPRQALEALPAQPPMPRSPFAAAACQAQPFCEPACGTAPRLWGDSAKPASSGAGRTGPSNAGLAGLELSPSGPMGASRSGSRTPRGPRGPAHTPSPNTMDAQGGAAGGCRGRSDDAGARTAPGRGTGARGSTSRYVGVSWNSNSAKWRAQMWLGRELHHLGYFEARPRPNSSARPKL